jgi:hypothetical protein
MRKRANRLFLGIFFRAPKEATVIPCSLPVGEAVQEHGPEKGDKGFVAGVLFREAIRENPRGRVRVHPGNSEGGSSGTNPEPTDLSGTHPPIAVVLAV